jgi:propionyl-CoA synthetase
MFQLVITANFSIEPTHQVEYKPLLDHAIELSEHKPRACIIYNVRFWSNISIYN